MLPHLMSFTNNFIISSKFTSIEAVSKACEVQVEYNGDVIQLELEPSKDISTGSCTDRMCNLDLSDEEFSKLTSIKNSQYVLVRNVIPPFKKVLSIMIFDTVRKFPNKPRFGNLHYFPYFPGKFHFLPDRQNGFCR